MYSIPFLVISETLHWLVSQSIFLARVARFDVKGDETPNESIFNCDYSLVAILNVINPGRVMSFLRNIN